MASEEAGELRVLLVDDHEVVREGLRAVLERAGISVIAEASTAREAVAAVVSTAPDLVLMDVRLPDGSGVVACREIRATHPEVKVLFLTAFEDEDALMATVFAAADGYLLKEIGSVDLVRAIRMVASGLSVLKPSTKQAMVERLRALGAVGRVGASAQLSAQERRAVALVAEGKTNKEVAAAMDLSPKTVKNYLSRIYQKLQVSCRAEAVARVMRDVVE
jgi:DNA-binding NarL/FixJ family response regulator